jgi:hypothetical protein
MRYFRRGSAAMRPPEHQPALALATLVGAALGFFVGVIQRPAGSSSDWEAIVWTLLGAFIVGGAVAVWRLFSK